MAIGCAECRRILKCLRWLVVMAQDMLYLWDAIRQRICYPRTLSCDMISKATAVLKLEVKSVFSHSTLLCYMATRDPQGLIQL